MDSVSDQLVGGRKFRVLTIVDLYTRECIALHADFSLRGRDVVYVRQEMKRKPQVITVDNGSEFTSREMETWAYLNEVRMDFIRPGRPVENCYIESFNGRFRDECLNVELFTTMADVRKAIATWREDYNTVRPHSALGGKAPAEASRLARNESFYPDYST